jgi:hypothetical protein
MPRCRLSHPSLLLVTLVAAPLGCGAGSSPAAAPAQQVLHAFAAPCPSAAAGPSGPGVPQVFVDAALFHAPTEVLAAQPAGQAASVAAAIEAANAETVIAPHILATDGVPAEVAISGGSDFRLSVLPRVEASGAVHLQLDVELDSGATAPARLQASVVVPEGEVAMVRAAAPGGDGEQLAMLVRPFVIRREADLARIMTCKQNAAQLHGLAKR